MKVYFHLIAVNIKSQMQYRLSFFLTTVGQFITAFTYFWGLYFLLDKVNAVDDFSYGQVFLCFAVIILSFSVGELVGAGFAVFPRLLGNGEFDRAMLRPKNVLLQVLVSHMDFTRFGLLAQAIFVLCIAVPSSGILWNWQKAFTLFLMILCGSILYFSFFFLKASLTFFTTASLEFMNILTYGTRQFGKYPFSVYGDGVLKFLTFVIPLALIQYYPLLYLLDRETSPVYMILPVLSLLFLIPCYAVFKLGIRKYKSTGS